MQCFPRRDNLADAMLLQLGFDPFDQLSTRERIQLNAVAARQEVVFGAVSG